MSLTEDKGIQLSGQACKAHDYDLMKPVVLASWKHGFQGSWSDKSAVLAESQVYTFSFYLFIYDIFIHTIIQMLYTNNLMYFTLINMIYFRLYKKVSKSQEQG